MYFWVSGMLQRAMTIATGVLSASQKVPRKIRLKGERIGGERWGGAAKVTESFLRKSSPFVR